VGNLGEQIMEENYNRSKLSCIMDFLFSLLLILFVIYAFIYGKLEPWTILLRILLLLISICVPYKKYVKKNINGLLYYIFLVLGAIIEIGFLMNYKISKDDNSLGAVLQFLAWVICIIVVLRIICFVVKNWKDIKYSSKLFAITFGAVSILGMVDNMTITGGIFLIGLILMLVSDDMMMLIQLKKPTSKILDTEKYSEEIKVRLFKLKVYISMYFSLLYIVLLCANSLGIKEIYKYFERDNPAWIVFFYKGLIYVVFILLIVIVVIAGILFMETKKDMLEKISKDLFYPEEIKEEKPKILEKIAIGNNIIDKINPEILIENRRDIPKEIYVLLEKIDNKNNIRNLIIIYPDKKVYRCKFNVNKTSLTRVTEVELIEQ
jgi:membrane protein